MKHFYETGTKHVQPLMQLLGIFPSYLFSQPPCSRLKQWWEILHLQRTKITRRKYDNHQNYYFEFLSKFLLSLIFSVIIVIGFFHSKNFICINADKRLVTLNEHNCFVNLIYLKHFSKPRKDSYILLLNAYFVKIKYEHENVHFNFFFQIFHIT